jgi:hypothetical protein
VDGDIIDFKKVKQDRLIPDVSYFVRVDLYEKGIAGEILDLGDLEPEMLRSVANNLQTLARWYRQQAFDIDDNDDHNGLMEILINSSGRVWTYVDNQVETREQEIWLMDMVDTVRETI